MARKYKLDNFKYLEQLKDRVSVPKFQRNFVWVLKQRKALINSLKKGLPAGCLLLQKLPSNDGTERYNIIDGRQRFSTLIHYERNRHLYVSDDDISNDDVKDVLNSCPSILNELERLRQDIREQSIEDIRTFIIDEFRKEGATLGNIRFDICEKINEKFTLNKNEKRDMDTTVQDFVNKKFDPVDLANLELPCIIFDADVDQQYVLDTFLNINKTGTKLDKYDIFDADWQQKFVYVDDDDIIGTVISRYTGNKAHNQDIDVEGFDETALRESKLINIYEYAYALSILISESCDIYKVSNKIQADPIGFNILTCIFNLHISEMSNLADVVIDSHVDLVDLKNKIIECVNIVEETLRPYCKAPSTKKMCFYCQAVNQFVSYVVTVFKTLYLIDINGKIQPNRAENGNLTYFKKNLPYWYLYDIIGQHWSGHGDAKLDRSVFLNAGEQISRKSDYFRGVDKESFASLLNNWLEAKNKESKGKGNVAADSKLFINYLIVKKSPGRTFGKQLDVEHIVTQSKLDDLKKSEGTIIYGISSPANLTLLPYIDNRKKKKETYYEYVARMTEESVINGTVFSAKLNNDELDALLYPSHSDIEFEESAFTSERYAKFLSDRAGQLVKEFLSLYYPE